MGLVVSWVHPETGTHYPSAYVRLAAWSCGTIWPSPEVIDEKTGEITPASVFGRSSVVLSFDVYEGEALRKALADPVYRLNVRVDRAHFDWKTDFEACCWKHLKERGEPYSVGLDTL